MLNKPFPFDPSIKHHLLIALCLSIWIFVFLYFTEPLDVSKLEDSEKLLYLPFYGIAGAISYVLMLPFQYWLLKSNNSLWSLKTELFFFSFFILAGLLISRLIYVYIVVANEPNMYDLNYFIRSLYLPAAVTTLPIVAACRWAFGKYLEKKQEDKKIEIFGEGAYEGLRIQQQELISIKSDDNYIEVSYQINGVLKKQLIRNKLSVIETSLPFLIRTHRSYLINPFHFQQWNSESGKLHIVLSDSIKIPISKTYSNKVRSVFNITS